jgi:hypothetical protein
MMQWGLMNAHLVLEKWFDDFAYMRDNYDWGLLTYTCHPQIIGRGHRMLMMEKLITKLREWGAIFLTMEQAVAEYHKKFFAGHRAGRLREIGISEGARSLQALGPRGDNRQRRFLPGALGPPESCRMQPLAMGCHTSFDQPEQVIVEKNAAWPQQFVDGLIAGPYQRFFAQVVNRQS